MGTITTQAESVYRDLEGSGSSAPHFPVKPDIRALFRTVDGQVQAALETALEGATAVGTWAELAALTGEDGQSATVALTDTGTHVDPATGSTVPNTGIFSYSVAEVGWVRIAPIGWKLQIPTIQTNVSTNIIDLTPLVPIGAEDPRNIEFLWKPVYPRLPGQTLYVAVVGLNPGDHREVRIPPGGPSNSIPDNSWDDNATLGLTFVSPLFWLSSIIQGTVNERPYDRTGYQEILRRREVDSAADAKTAAREA